MQEDGGREGVVVFEGHKKATGLAVWRQEPTVPSEMRALPGSDASARAMRADASSSIRSAPPPKSRSSSPDPRPLPLLPLDPPLIVTASFGAFGNP